MAAIRRNINITLLVHNDHVYGLTKGQASPTSQEGFVTKAQPQGVASEPFNAVAVAVSMRASFVARGFSGKVGHLWDLIQQGIAHRGFALIDILQSCVSFNKINTFAWYKDRCYTLPRDYDPMDWHAAISKSSEWGDKIPIGVIYKNERLTFEAYFAYFVVLKQGPLVLQDFDKEEMQEALAIYG